MSSMYGELFIPWVFPKMVSRVGSVRGMSVRPRHEALSAAGYLDWNEDAEK